MLFFLALILYITSLVGSLVLFIISKKIYDLFFKIATLVHAFFLSTTIINFIAVKSGNTLPLIFPLSFLFFCCSGLLIFGIVINKSDKTILKIYFSLFLLTFPAFLIKPSGLIHYLLFMEIKNSSGTSFAIYDNFFLESQETTLNQKNEGSTYKLVRKIGLYTKTIQRDIIFNTPIDSLKTVYFQYPDSICIRIYSSSEINQMDSIDNIIIIKKSNKINHENQ